MLRLIPNLKVQGRRISTEIQCMVLSAFLQEIDRGEIITWVHDWLNCSLKESAKIVNSTLAVCMKEKVKI